MPVAEALKFAFAVQTPLSVLTVILEGHVTIGDLTIVAVPDPAGLIQPFTVCVTV